VREPQRAVRAAAIAAVGVPCALLAHLLATGRPAEGAAAVLAALAVLGVAAVLRARNAIGFAAVTALTQLAAQAVLAGYPSGTPSTPPACIPAVGRAATLGVHLAMLTADERCPSGSLALGALAAAALTALLVALAILAGNALVAVLAGVLLGRALATHDLLAGLAGVLARLLAVAGLLLGRTPQVPLGVVRVMRPRRTFVPLREQWWPGVPAWRGPPVAPLPLP
jgi:hypothetical protein